MTDKHTPTPWAYKSNGSYFDVGIQNDSEVLPIYPLSIIGVPLSQEANARHIVKCVNAHDRLVALLKELHEALIEEYPYYTGGAEHDEVERLFNELDTKKESE